MHRSRLFWQLAGTNLLLVLAAVLLPGLLGAPLGTCVLLATLLGAFLTAAELSRRIRQLAETVQARFRDPSVSTEAPRSSDDLGELTQAVNQLVQQYDELRTRIGQEQQSGQQAREAADLATTARGDFLAILSHEIRTPLNGILGMTQLALQTQLDAEQREYLEIVRSSGDFLLAIVNDLRDFARREAGGVASPLVRFPLRQTLAETVKLLGLRAQQKGLELLVRVAPDVPDGLEGDPDRLRQLLVNLLTNAITFTERGEVVLSVAHAADRGSKTEIALNTSLARLSLQFQVKDTGIGIPEDKLALLIDSLPGVRQAGNGGLGLTIARQLADSMGGSLGGESVVGKGSTFHFELPFQLSRDSGSRDLPLPHFLAGVRTLLVDDNATCRNILLEVLSSWQMRVTPAATANDAIAGLQEADHEPYGLAVIDAHMPDIDGFALVDRIRQRPQTVSLPILMLTAAHPPEDAARCRQKQIPAHVMKPVHHAELLRGIQQALNVREPIRAEPPPKQAGPRPLRVLVAEANPVNRQLAVVVLEKLGHTVLQAPNGREALRMLEGGSIDLFLLDPHLSDPSGVEIVVAVRAKEKEKGGHLPIIALLPYGTSEDRERYRAAGIDSYLAKPLQPLELTRALESVRPVGG